MKSGKHRDKQSICIAIDFRFLVRPGYILTDIAIENGPVEKVSLHMKNRDFPWLCKRLPERVVRIPVLYRPGLVVMSSQSELPYFQDDR